MTRRADADLLARTVFDEAPCFAALVDAERKVVQANRAFERVFGEGFGKPCYSVAKGRAKPCEDCVAVLAFEDGEIHESEEEGRSAGGEAVWYSARAVPVRGPEGEVEQVLLLCLDTTRSKELETALDQAERLAAAGLSTAGLAHTIKNLLAGLEGGVYVVDSSIKKGDRERLEAGWEMVRGYIDRVGALVQGLLRLVRTEERPREAVSPIELIDDVLDLYRDKAGFTSIALEKSVEDGLPAVLVERETIHGCLANLVTNAMDACAWDPDLDKEHCIALSARAGGEGSVVFEVADNGPGISEENQKKVLSLMFTTKGLRGTGLGLLLTRKAVEQHGGRVDFESTPGEGTTFRIELPSAAA
jgi:PAS domain S-box-containing protein